MVLRVNVDQTLCWPTDETKPHWPNLKLVDIRFLCASPSGAWYFQGPQGEGCSTSPGYEITQEHYEPLEANETDYKFDRDGGLRSTAGNYSFRVVPIEETLRPLLVSLAKAATSMPSLHKSMLWTNLEFDFVEVFPYYEDQEAEMEEKYGGRNDCHHLFWGIAYSKPAEHISLHGMGIEDCNQRQLYWFVHDWQPDDTLRALFQGIGESEHGGEVIEHWASEKGQKWLSSKYIYDKGLDDSLLA